MCNQMINQTATAESQEWDNDKAKCSDASRTRRASGHWKGEILSCPGCGLELEVKQANGGCINLKINHEGEDWGE